MHRRRARPLGAATAALALGLALFGLTELGPGTSAVAAPPPGTATPIEHLVVIYQEHVSFDHYFGTYRAATNTSGQHFSPIPGTPSVNGPAGELLTANPNGTTPAVTTPPRSPTS